MAIVAGIDEAGYGPILGPLVVSSVAFEVPDAAAEQCLWAQLADSISNKVRQRDRRLPIVDSKKLHHSQNGIGAVEQTSLVMLAAAGARSLTFHKLLAAICPGLKNDLPGYPWYQHFEEQLPLQCDPGLIGLRANAVARNMRANSITFLAARCAVLPEGHYNRLIEATRNKATVLWSLTLRLIGDLIRLAGRRDLHIFIDRQGARTRHAQTLLTAFEGSRLVVLEEKETVSRYRLHPRGAAGPDVTLEFRESGEEAHLPIALASIFSKYLRELFMVAFNRYWQQQVDGVKRTAGYYQDGLRFLRDIEPAITSLRIDRRMLVRSR